MMSFLQNHEINCECQYTLTFMDKVVEKQLPETKDGFNHVPSIHEVDEENMDEEHACDHELVENSKDILQATSVPECINEDSIYSNESFCSDESDDESGETNVSSRSLNDSHFSSQITDRECDKKNNEDNLSENVTQNNGINSTNCKSSISDDNSIVFKPAKSKRRNMSFTDEELWKIEWENQLLLKKIMAQQKPKDKVFNENIQQTRISSSAINRRKLQRKIENENILLLQRIQQAKSRVMNTMTKSGYRQTIL